MIATMSKGSTKFSKNLITFLYNLVAKSEIIISQNRTKEIDIRAKKYKRNNKTGKRIFTFF